MRAHLDEIRHLTWRGRCSMLYYAARRLIRTPAGDDRCFMGAPIGDHVWCPRAAAPESLWCPHHLKEIERAAIIRQHQEKGAR